MSAPSLRLLSFLLGLEAQGFDEPPLLTLGCHWHELHTGFGSLLGPFGWWQLPVIC